MTHSILHPLSSAILAVLLFVVYGWCPSRAIADTALDPNQLTAVNGILYFEARDASHGYELWRSDGTVSGTFMVKDINPGTAHSMIGSLTDVNGTLFFSADNGVNGWELWKSNGTTNGTVLVKDIKPGELNSGPNDLVNINGTVFFTASDSGSNRELWKSDGTADGTVRVKDIRPGADGSFPDNLLNFNGTLFFSAEDGVNGVELWRSNGTETGTVRIGNINPGSGSSSPYFLTGINNTLFFQADDGSSGVELWKFVTTAAAPVRVKDINPNANGSDPYDLINVNGTLFFVANDGTNGEELWKSNGLSTGTVIVSNINPGAANSSPFYSTVSNNTLFFGAENSTGFGLWKSNGTAAGTTLVKNINPGGTFADVGGTLFLPADDGSNGFELWKSNGTTAGTTLVKNIHPTADANPHSLINVGGTLFFAAYDGSQSHLWRSNGTDASTYPLVEGVTPPTFSISGRIYDSRGYGIAGATVTRGAGTPAVSNSAGYYTLTSVPAGAQTLVAGKSDYTFTPASRSIIVSDNIGGQDFLGKTGVNVSGRISNSRGTAIAGVTVARSDGGTAGISNSAGYYTLIGVQAGSITLTPSRSGYRFTPTSRVVTVGTSDISGVNFIGATGYSIIGRIVNSSGVGTVNVAVTRTGLGTPVYTNSAGYYTFTDVPNGNYTIRPSGTGLSFSPESRSVTMNGADITGLNFTSAPGYQIVGRVSNSSGTGIGGVTVARSGSAVTAITNSAGYYTFNGVANGSYTLTPSLSSYSFTPATRTVTISGANVSNQNFIGSSP